FPSLRPRDMEDEKKSLEEERRLAYVAFTRAKERLVLTSARMRRQWAEVKLNPPSRFIDDIPAEHLAVRERPAAPRPPAGHLVRAPRAAAQSARYEVDDFDQRVFEDDVPEYRQDSGGNGSGKDQKLLIDFASVGLKTVLARFVSTD